MLRVILAVSLAARCGVLWSQENLKPPLRAETAETDAEGPRLYDGLTVEAWQARMKAIDFQSPLVAEAVPGLVELIQDEDLPWYTRRQAALTLGRIGKPAESAIPIFISLLAPPEHPSEIPTPAWAAKALALMGSAAAPAAPALARVLADPKRSLLDRLSATEALARIGGANEEAVSALIQIVSSQGERSSDAEELRLAGLDGLSLVGSAAAPAGPRMLELLQSDSEQVRTKAAVVLGTIGPGASFAAESLMELVLFDESGSVREAASAALATLGPKGEAALLKLIGDEDPDVRRLAALMLGRVRASEQSTASLKVALEDEVDEVRVTAAESLWTMLRSADPILPTALELLTVDNRPVRIRAVKLLRTMGPSAKSAIPALKKLSSDERPFVRQAALRILQDLEAAPAF